MEKYLKIYKKLKPGDPAAGFILIPITNILSMKISNGLSEITIIYNDRTKSGKRATTIQTEWTPVGSSFNDAKIIFKREILDALASDQKFTLSTLIVGDVKTNVSK